MLERCIFELKSNLKKESSRADLSTILHELDDVNPSKLKKDINKAIEIKIEEAQNGMNKLILN